MSRPRSSTVSSFTASITTWASAVHPGSPAPLSPRSANAFAGTFPSTPRTSKSVYTPTSAHYAQFDLTNLGYTSVFVHLPKTPSTPSHLNNKPNHTRNNKKDNKPRNHNYPPSHKCEIEDASSHQAKTNPFSLSRARSRSTSMSVPAKSKKQLPPTLMNELMLMQFAGGGKMSTHITRVMDAQTKQQGNLPVGTRADVYRDASGRVWWDRDEQIEYQWLLQKDDPDASDSSDSEGEEAPSQWVKFRAESLDAQKVKLAPMTLQPILTADGKKKRPTPLNLARKEFLEQSFMPPTGPLPPIPVSARPIPSHAHTPKKSKMSIRGFFHRS
ncbi:hypothetical protein EDD18DRAFT_1144047 [Armillaria luteobubalina]|uniref:Uncharacterized protein n=1 Tax=Armillaria luteobubalina TaxID=153913 RepID=A0AA39V1G9_9AGAR|nr:hypothetical protein EDD18DRAFT_1144047 [Armillaria luteobubalina]